MEGEREREKWREREKVVRTHEEMGGKDERKRQGGRGVRDE